MTTAPLTNEVKLRSRSYTLANVEIAASMFPKGEHCGDFYKLVLRDSKIGVILADSNKKGQEAADHSQEIVNEYEARLKKGMKPSEAMLDLAIEKGTGRYTKFATLQYVEIQQNNHMSEVSIYSAGHDFPILYMTDDRLNKKLYRWPQIRSLAIGFPRDFHGKNSNEELDKSNRGYPKSKVFLSPGDYLVIFTDGATEEKRHYIKDGEEKHDALKRGGLVSIVDDLIVNKKIISPRGIVDSCRDEITAFRQGSPQNDDMTLIVAKIRKPYCPSSY